VKIEYKSAVAVLLVATAIYASGPEKFLPQEKGVLAESVEDFSGYCFGAVQASQEGQDEPWWAGWCLIKIREDGFEIEVNLVGPVQETFSGRTETSITFRDDPHTMPLVFIRFEDWISLTILPSSSEVQNEIIRLVNSNGDRKPLTVTKKVPITGRGTNWDRPDIHSLTIEVRGISFHGGTE